MEKQAYDGAGWYGEAHSKQVSSIRISGKYNAIFFLDFTSGSFMLSFCLAPKRRIIAQMMA